MIETKLRAKLGISVKAFVVLVAFSLGSSAHAAMITGDIGFGGVFTPTDDAFNPVALEDATAIDFGFNFVLLATEDFGGLAGNLVDLKDFSFVSFSPVDPLWSIGGFSFALDSVDIDTQNAKTLSLFGTGVISHAGFDDTTGSWNFTGQPAGSTSFSFSAGSGAVAVPEPSIIALFGLGLLGLGFARRRKYS